MTVLRDLIVQRAPEIAETISRGMGKPLVESLSYDVAMVVEDLTGYIKHGAEYLADEPVEISPAAQEGAHSLRSARRGLRHRSVEFPI